MKGPNSRNRGAPPTTNSFKSCITPFCHRNGRGFPCPSNETPATCPASLMDCPTDCTSPGSVPKSFITPRCQRNACDPPNGELSGYNDDTPTTCVLLLTASAIFRAVVPRFPRSWGLPSASHSTACGPYASGGSTRFAHVPVAPTACPWSLIAIAIPIVSPGSGASVRICPTPGPQTTAWKLSACGPVPETEAPGGQFGSRVAVSAPPTTSARLFMKPTLPLFPPSSGSCRSAPRSQMYGRHF